MKQAVGATSRLAWVSYVYIYSKAVTSKWAITADFVQKANFIFPVVTKLTFLRVDF
jgi:hypothetical protein